MNSASPSSRSLLRVVPPGLVGLLLVTCWTALLAVGGLPGILAWTALMTAIPLVALAVLGVAAFRAVVRRQRGRVL